MVLITIYFSRITVDIWFLFVPFSMQAMFLSLSTLQRSDLLILLSVSIVVKRIKIMMTIVTVPVMVNNSYDWYNKQNTISYRIRSKYAKRL